MYVNYAFLSGMWLHPNSAKQNTNQRGIHGVFSTINNWNPAKQTDATFAGQTYDFEMMVTQNSLVWTQNGVKVVEIYNYESHRLYGSQPCYLGDPWHDAADVVLTNLKIIENWSECSDIEDEKPCYFIRGNPVSLLRNQSTRFSVNRLYILAHLVMW